MGEHLQVGCVRQFSASFYVSARREGEREKKQEWEKQRERECQELNLALSQHLVNQWSVFCLSYWCGTIVGGGLILEICRRGNNKHMGRTFWKSFSNFWCIPPQKQFSQLLFHLVFLGAETLTASVKYINNPKERETYLFATTEPPKCHTCICLSETKIISLPERGLR